ncbi:hypothetical protein EG68_11093, partial [Paragonimus skrjabini miyazakii]
MMDSCPVEFLNIHNSSREIEDYFERFEIWCLTGKEMKAKKKAAHFLTVIGKDAYSLVKNLSFPDSPISLPYESLKKLLLSHVQPVKLDAAQRAKFHTLVRKENQDIRQFIVEIQS